ncbi:hypothetical protein [Halomonas sp. MS1]|nr:hypothetical protein [Halomonas sp. MS1]UTD55529.1 hypothetical protein NF683_20700 [Halomonas sp. MS1]
MKKVKILGPSYSGTTVLGYVLNTSPGWFFGSEVHRLLYSYIQRYGARNKNIANPKCDFCGLECKYWSRKLLMELKENKVDTLQGIYDVFESHHPEVSVFVDGSKKLDFFHDTEVDYTLIASKHPVRLLASRFYNKRESLGVKGEELSSVYSAIQRDKAKFLDYAKGEINYLYLAYSDFFKNSANGMLVKMDEIVFSEKHKNDFLDFLDLNYDDVSFDGFTNYEIHSIGGNRAPYWARLEKSTDKLVSNPRHEYYKSAESVGDFKVDDKYKEIFDDDFLSEIEMLVEYQELLKILGYKRMLV